MFSKCLIVLLSIHLGCSTLVSMLAESIDVTIEDDGKTLKTNHIVPNLEIKNTLNKTDFTFCPCKKILVSSLGEAANVQSAALGVYQYYQEYSGHPSYYGPTNLHRSNRLYYSSQYQGYILGDKLGSNVGYLYVPSTLNCPYLIPGGWQYYAGRWFVDATLVVRCIPS
eukprot:TRINITY_DN10032_c0_g1_i13.p1 TRINITY_DN10032_c0_g1~~TRINITY_DN10032_c0_g1_i13.p1  ORF type:complete len:168 (-),score=0.39 TRINITY_DN10032_c0_g1_i13:108-611(-)